MYVREEGGRTVKIRRGGVELLLENAVTEIDDEWGKRLLAQGGFVEITKEEFEKARSIVKKPPAVAKPKGVFKKMPELKTEKKKGDD